VTPLIVPLHGYDLILGMPWLTNYNPHIDWRTRTLSFFTPGQEEPPSTKDPPTGGVRSRQRYRIKQTPQLNILTTAAELQRWGQEEDGIMWLCHLGEVADVPEEEKKLPLELAGLLEPILEEYQDVFRKELPPGLPPQREVDHRITLKHQGQSPSPELHLGYPHLN
jgi:hypothetical protein